MNTNSNTGSNTEVIFPTLPSEGTVVFNPFSSTSVDFEKMVEEHEPVFGVLNLLVKAFPLTTKPLSVSLMIDNSASMEAKCADGLFQQDHVNFTADKVLRYLRNHDIDADVSVSSFDNNVVSVVEPQPLTQDNIETISRKIKCITPNGATNICAVLEQEAKWTQPYSTQRKRIMFLFTDGVPTCGYTTTTSELIRKSQRIHPNTTIVTIGCGTSHCSELLKGIADRKRGIYKFIGNIEEVSFACGEILDTLLNDVAEDCEIEATNGDIWDWKKNNWVSKIQVRNLVGECNKTYHVRTTTPSTFVTTFSGVSVETSASFQCVIDEIHENADVRKHKFRQETLVLLHETNERCKHGEINMNHGRLEELKVRLTEFVTKMKAFMDENDLREDLFMKMLCDDIFVCYNAIGTPLGHMYISSRQTSQATQGIHTNMCSVAPPPRGYNYNGLGSFPLCSRQVTQSINMMQNNCPVVSAADFGFDIDEEDDNDDAPKMSRNPSCVRNTSMSVANRGWSYGTPLQDSVFGQTHAPAQIYQNRNNNVSHGGSTYISVGGPKKIPRSGATGAPLSDADLFAELDGSSLDLFVSNGHQSLGHEDSKDQDQDQDTGLPQVMARHVSMPSYISPYSNVKTMSVIREVSHESCIDSSEEK
jgi:hypothetical protein